MPSTPSQFTDGQGTYITSDSTNYSGKGKCWLDYYVVSQSASFAPQVQNSDEIDCEDADTCTLERTDGYLTCEVWSEIFGGGVSAGIFNFGARAFHSLTKCWSANSSYTCGWTSGCHVIFSSQQIVTQEGYKRCRCNMDGKKDNDVTEWLEDWTHTAPTNSVIYSCGDVDCPSD
ncbi:hypothetical protein JAAARDRAFT_132987 [Jaapia argillacea MUCL 33604]|uniref:Uncharacterized protein n=1 Tax=Jaapia argillacea MUCL 33604 TaxID=933084 RepID=A0A067PMN9_9AGAM|nr:hypothetical protein JAAARDRAFT_132987 [Jaapia argillacea MUCL 33604]